MAKFKYDIDYRKEYPGENISDDVITFLKESDSKQKYFEYELKREKQVRRKNTQKADTPIIRPSREDSLDRLIDLAHQFASAEDVESCVIKKVMIEKMMHCVVQLAENERNLITALYFEHKSQVQLEKETGVKQQTISYREKKILKKLEKMLQK